MYTAYDPPLNPYKTLPISIILLQIDNPLTPGADVQVVPKLSL